MPRFEPEGQEPLNVVFFTRLQRLYCTFLAYLLKEIAYDVIMAVCLSPLINFEPTDKFS